MFEHGLAVRGTIVGYDDWWVQSCARGGEAVSPLETGEGKAHAEIAEEYGVTFRCVAGACKLSEKCPFCNPIFVVESVRGKGAQGGHHGFDMTDSDITDASDGYTSESESD